MAGTLMDTLWVFCSLLSFAGFQAVMETNGENGQISGLASVSVLINPIKPNVWPLVSIRKYGQMDSSPKRGYSSTLSILWIRALMSFMD